MELDMTKGSPSRLILKFIVPLIIGNIFQQLYSMVDTIIVGQYVGVQALAAVGATGTINFLILGFMMGMTSGYGARSPEVRRGRPERNACEYCQRGEIIRDRNGGYDVDKPFGNARAVTADEYAVGYF